MTDRNKLKDRARDELFSHINRCGVLQAAEEDQEHWMDETMDYLAERYPDLSDADLKELYAVGLRFCRPAIPHGRNGSASATDTADEEPAGEASQGMPDQATPDAETSDDGTSGEGGAPVQAVGAGAEEHGGA